ncbi:Pro-resilin [Amphibalanus amphitrite]|uniref:Pro-resilin n=1 Tax=Amphibalanus amphitrite TaxID=1232801 RepID=A0A6A4V2Y2_AMPAM|nr:Pro-resilin [Amphibalanus amphitrite]
MAATPSSVNSRDIGASHRGMESREVFAALLLLVAAASAVPQGYGAPQGSAPQSYGAPQTSYGTGQEEFPPQPYSFEYEVKDDEGNDYGHKEESDGSRVEGVYRVLLPDTRVQTVTYYVEGDSGFVADVQYEGEAQFPEDSQNGQYGAAAPNNGYGAPSPATGYGSPF